MMKMTKRRKRRVLICSNIRKKPSKIRRKRRFKSRTLLSRQAKNLKIITNRFLIETEKESLKVLKEQEEEEEEEDTESRRHCVSLQTRIMNRLILSSKLLIIYKSSKARYIIQMHLLQLMEMRTKNSLIRRRLTSSWIRPSNKTSETCS